MYFNRLIKANEFTKEIGLPGVEINPRSKNEYLSLANFHSKIKSHLGITHPNQLFQCCSIVSVLLKTIIEETFNCKAYVTIGDINNLDRSIYNINENYIRSIITPGKNSLNTDNYRHHAWITLDSMEIIDYTHLTTYSYHNKTMSNEQKMKYLSAIISGTPETLKLKGMEYVPVMVGDEFYRKYDSTYKTQASIYVQDLLQNDYTDAPLFAD